MFEMPSITLTPELLFKLKEFVKSPKVIWTKKEYEANHIPFDKDYVAIVYADGYAAHVDVKGYKVFLDEIGTKEMPEFVEFTGDFAQDSAELLLFTLAIMNGEI